jgi:hypothetical protein
MVLSAFLFSAGKSQDYPLQTQGWFVFHTSIATAGVAALAVSFAMSLLFLVKERALKTKRSLRVLEMLPTLEALDRLGFQALLYGFPLLTLARIIHELRASVTSRRFFASAALWREVLRCSRRHGSLPNGSNVSARTRSAFVASPFDRNRANLDLRDRFDDGFRA